MNNLCVYVGKLKLGSLFALLSITCGSAVPLAALANQKGDVQTVASVEPGKLKATAVGKSAQSCKDVFAVFSDFNAMSKFLPGVSKSEIITRSPEPSIVKQSGQVRYGIVSLSFDTDSVLSLSEPLEIVTSARPQSVTKLDSVTKFTQGESVCTVSYSFALDYAGSAPEFLARAMAKSIASSKMVSMLAQVDKRFKGQPGKPSVALVGDGHKESSDPASQ